MIGAVNIPPHPPAVICRAGWASSQRPPLYYTSKIKRSLLPAGTTMRQWVLDHIVPIELDGNPYMRANLQLETPTEAHQKDYVENLLHARVCSGRMTLAAAQFVFETGAWRAYR